MHCYRHDRSRQTPTPLGHQLLRTGLQEILMLSNPSRLSARKEAARLAAEQYAQADIMLRITGAV
jgi:hypothetical protein